jgi:predicted Rossmann fold nucleotide-binding protein DprA/Smf involved in DNA uptake
LNELGVLKSKKIDKEVLDHLNELEKTIIELLSSESKHLDEISRELKISAAQISAILIKLEISGLVKNIGSGIYTKF